MTRTDWSVAVDHMTPKQLAEACREEGYWELAVELVRRNVEALAAGERTGVVELSRPGRVFVLDDYRKEQGV